MSEVRLIRNLSLVVIGMVAIAASSLRADDPEHPTLQDVHKVLLQAAGYQADTPPTTAQQTQLLQRAQEMLKKLPHIFHGQLKGAEQAVEAALGELSTGDTAHKARVLIFDADDKIKSIM